MTTVNKFVYVITAAMMVGCAPTESGEPQAASTASELGSDESLFEGEDIFLTRAQPASGNFPVGDVCSRANFPSTHPPVREQDFLYTSVKSDSRGRLTDADRQEQGTHRGCYSGIVGGVIWTYAEGTFNGIPFNAKGPCTITSQRPPGAGIPYTCSYELGGLPAAYHSGHATFNAMTASRTNPDDYLITSVGNLRLWKTR